MPLRVTGMRLGVNIYTPSGTVRNGAIDSAEHREYLTSIGYRLQHCNGIPEPVPTDEDREEIARVKRESDKFRSMIARGLDDMLAPLRKKSYRNEFQ